MICEDRMCSSGSRLVLKSCLFCVIAGAATAHPPSAIVVDNRGRGFFTDAAEGVFRFDDGRPTRINASAMHWMALDRRSSFAEAPEEFGEWFGRITPPSERPTLISCSDFPCV